MIEIKYQYMFLNERFQKLKGCKAFKRIKKNVRATSYKFTIKNKENEK